MELAEIEKIFIDEVYNDCVDWSKPSKMLYVMHLKSCVTLLEGHLYHPTKPGYKRHDVELEINHLKDKIKTYGK